MNLSDPRARALWRKFVWRVRVALVDARRSAQRELLADLDAHISEALAREAPDLSEAERLERALARVGDPVQFLRRGPDDASRAIATRPERLRLFAAVSAALLWGTAGIALIVLGLNALACPQGAGLFQLGPEEFQIRWLCGGAGGSPLGAPWFAIASAGAGAALLWLSWRNALRVWALVLFGASNDAE